MTPQELQQLLGRFGGLGRQSENLDALQTATPTAPVPATPSTPMATPDPFEAMLKLMGPSEPEEPKPASTKEKITTAVGDFLGAVGEGLRNRGRRGQSTGAGAAMVAPKVFAAQRAQQALE